MWYQDAPPVATVAEYVASVLAHPTGQGCRGLDVHQVRKAGSRDGEKIGWQASRSVLREEDCVDIHPTTQARVIADYQAPYADPIAVQAGDEVLVNNIRKADWAGWVW